MDGKQVLAPSMTGIEADDVELGQGVTLGSAKSRKMDEHYHLFGAHAEAVNHANETTVPAQSRQRRSRVFRLAASRLVVRQRY